MIDIKHWFVAVVEDTNDPLGMGRVRVRVTSYHNPDHNELPTIDLPWATCMLPTTSASIAGIGLSSTGLELGSWVVGFFRDGEECQDPFIIGTFASSSSGSSYDPTSNFGFGDPHGTHNGFSGLDIPGEAGSGSSPFGGSVQSSQHGFGGVGGAVSGSLGSLEPGGAPLVLNGSVDSILSVAKSQIGVRATFGKNQGPGIDKYWTATNTPDGYAKNLPWCAAFACWCIAQSGIVPASALPKTAAAFGFNDWAKGKGRSVTELRYNPRFVRRGDIVVFAHSHVGFALTDSDASGNFTSIDGNTSRKVGTPKRHISALQSAISILGNKLANV